MHDPRLGRFFAVAPLTKKYPWNSPYAFSENRVIDGVELEGLEYFFTASGKFLGKYGNSRKIMVTASDNYNDFNKGKITINELVNNRSVKLLKMPDYVISNIYTTIYKSLPYKNKTKLYNNKISVGNYNIPPVYDWFKEKEYQVGRTKGEAQTMYNPLKKEAAILVYKKSDDYYDISVSTILHEKLHINLEEKGIRNAGKYELNVYSKIMDSPLFEKLSEKEIKLFKKSYRHYLDRFFKTKNPSKQNLILARKIKAKYEKKFDEKLYYFGNSLQSKKKKG